MVDYAKIQNKVNTKIGSYGRAMTISVATRATYDSDLDTYAETVTDYETKMLVTDYSSNNVDGTLVMEGDKKALVPAYGLPRLDRLSENQYFTVTEDGREVDAKHVSTLAPGDTALMYELRLRGY